MKGKALNVPVIRPEGVEVRMSWRDAQELMWYLSKSGPPKICSPPWDLWALLDDILEEGKVESEWGEDEDDDST